MKRIVIVDEDVDLYDLNDVEWATWSRTADPSKILIFPDAVSFEWDRSAKAGMKSVRVGIDATKDLEDVEKLRRTKIPGIENIKIDDYIR